MSATQIASKDYLWPFDWTLQDTSSTFNGTPINNPTYFQRTITGYGASLSLNSSMHQSVSINQSFVPLYNRSWTFEAWIYLYDVNSAADFPILWQCPYAWTSTCLHLVVRDKKLFLGFYSDDLHGYTTMIASRWYHTAFVYVSDTHEQSLYLDGVLDGSRRANSSYLRTNGTLNIGVNYWPNDDRYFHGLIDQFSFSDRSKTSQEILHDATLTLSVSFDGNSTFDEGPLKLDGSLAGSTSFVPGRRGQGLQIDNVSQSYFTVQGLVLLGRSHQSYSFAIWIKPAVPQKATIIHMSSAPSGASWCLPILGLTDASRLLAIAWDGSGINVTGPVVSANSWTHAVVTYSSAHGLRLYVNGCLYNVSAPFFYVASGESNHVFVGSSRDAGSCYSLSDIRGQYSGAVDELRVYSRELFPGDILALANLVP